MEPIQPKTKKQKTAMENVFPDDLIPDIMAALPVKSILRFRCLSKSWQAFLTSPFFINKQLLNQSKTKPERLIISSGETFRLVKFEANKETEWNELEFEFPLKSPKQDKNKNINILGSCNGLLLLLLGEQESLILWNPITKESQKIMPFPRILSVHIPAANFGFGYDQSTDDFKVVIFDYITSSSVHIYSLRSNTWKKINGFPKISIDQSKSGILVDEFLYWSTKSCAGRFVLGFNLKSDKLEKIRPPNDIKQYNPWGLGLIKGCLSLAQNHFGLRINMWKLVKDETKKSQSWIKMMSIIINLKELTNPDCWVPYCIMNNAEVLLSYFNNQVFFFGYPNEERFQTLRLQLYDPVNCKLRPGMRDYSQAVTYVESLVSPKVCIESSSNFLQFETMEFTDLYGKDWSKSF